MNRAQRRQRDNLTRQLRAHIAEHGIEAGCDLGQPALCPR